MQGVSLISLMVGLAIASMVMLAALGLFQRMTKSTGEARKDAQRSAQRNAGLAAVELLLQSAGFGVEGAQWGVHVQQLSVQWDAEQEKLLPADGQSNAVVWAENTAGTVQCHVLWSPYDAGGLRLLGPASCADTQTWQDSEDWGEPRSLNGAGADVVHMQYDAVACMPFGIGSALDRETARAQITLSTTSNQGQALASSVCLVNVKLPAAVP